MQEEAVERVLAEGLHERYVIAVAGENWHHGIVGIVAGRLVEQFRRPAFVLGQHGEGLLKGSARSIPGFHLKDAIDELRPLLASGGGHAMAAGVSLDQANFAAFADGLDALARQVLTPEHFVPVIPIDSEVSMAEADLRAAEELSLLEPYGMANPQPIFAVRGVTLDSTGLTKSGEHARLTWRQDRQTRTTFVWGQPELAKTPTGGVYDVAFQMEINEYQGRREVKWQMVDYRPSA
jgi:single-stranded-DNA-specific exonuclease